MKQPTVFLSRIASALFFIMTVMLIISAPACSGGAASGVRTDDTTSHSLPDTLRVGTLYSPMSYFIYRGEPMGYDYSLINDFATAKGLVLDLQVATSLNSLVRMLDSGEVDILAYEIPVTAEYKEHIIPCGPETFTSQVLVQPKQPKGGYPRITNVTELIGRDVYVEKDSKYQHRLENINENLGGGINIHPIDRDTLITEDLIEMVSQDEIPLTIVDSDIARINKTYYPNLDISLEVSFPQKASWGVASGNAWLADSINAWFAMDEPRKENAVLLKRYFELSKGLPPSIMTLDLSKGHVSPFDAYFRTYASEADIDWRLLASQGFVESRFNPSAVSWAGARGVMQIMPGTGRQFGASPAQLADTETSIRLATKIYNLLDKSLSSDVPDPVERRKFIMAAYNGGIAHVRDAIALAKKYGLNPQVWDGNVEKALLMKSKPEYFNDPVCRYGYFRGTETTRYVKDVISLYDRVRKRIKA